MADIKWKYLEVKSKKELKAIVQDEDHNYYPDPEGSIEYLHADWDCETCEAEKELTRRRVKKDALKPGYCTFPATAKVYGYGSKYAHEMQVGFEAKYNPTPGISDYCHVYASAIAVEVGETHVDITWQMTNSPTAEPFTARYQLMDSLQCAYPLKA